MSSLRLFALAGMIEHKKKEFPVEIRIFLSILIGTAPHMATREMQGKPLWLRLPCTSGPLIVPRCQPLLEQSQLVTYLVTGELLVWVHLIKQFLGNLLEET